MGENNNKPIGFTGFSGPYARSLSTEKNSIWDYPIGNSVRPDPGRPVHLVWGAYGVCLGFPIAPGGGQCLRGADGFGKMCVRRGQKKFGEKFAK